MTCGLDAPLRTILDRFHTGGFGPLALDTWVGVQIAEGGIVAERLNVFGYADSQTTTAYPLWPPGTGAYPWATLDGGDQTLRVVSASANDDVGSTGATSVRLWWLDSTGAETQTDVNLDGVNLVDSAATTARRLNRAEVLTCGATGYNEGIISIYATDGATLVGRIDATRGASFAAIQTVPIGMKDVITDVWTGDARTANRRYYEIVARDSASSPWLYRGPVHVTGGIKCSHWCPSVPLVLSAGADYYVKTNGLAAAAAYARLCGYRIPTP